MSLSSYSFASIFWRRVTLQIIKTPPPPLQLGSKEQFDERVGKNVSHHPPPTISGVTDFDYPDTALKFMRFLPLQRRNQPSDARKFTASNSLANVSAFS